MRNLKTPLLLALIVALLAAGVAAAHSDLIRSDPAPGTMLDAAPARVTIWFSEAIEPSFSTISVLFEDGATADGGDSQVSSTDPTQLSVSLTDQREGTYVVSWRVLSAVDGHITSGSFVFAAGKSINRSVAGQAGGAVTSPLDMLARALAFIGQATLVGVIIFRWLVWRPSLKAADLDETIDDRAIARNRRLINVALGLVAAGAVLTLLVQSTLAGTTLGGWLGTRVGRIWIGRVATLIGLAVLAEDIASVGRKTDRQGIILNVAVAWLGLQLLLTTSLTSHSAAIVSPPLVPLLADWLHLIGTAVWVGGLAQMAFVVPSIVRTLDDEDRAWLWLKVVVYFSTIAALGLGILLTTGTYIATLHVGDWPALLSTAYGQSLLFKLALAGVAMLLGAYNLFVIKPRLDRAVDAPEAGAAQAVQHRFRRLVAFEALAALAVLASAGILTDLPRSKDPQPVAAGQRLELSTRTENLDAAIAIDPALSGNNTFEVKLSQGGAAITDASDVSLRFTYLARSLGTTQAQATLAGDLYTANGAYLALPGNWQIEVAVRRPNTFDVFAAYRVKVGLDGRIGPATEATLVESITRWLSLYGLAFGGGVAVVMGLVWLLISTRASRTLAWQAVLLVPALIALPIGALSLFTFFREATPGLALTNPFLPDEQSLQIGQQLFEANCVVCHGAAGRGDGPSAASLPLKPPDYANGHLDIHTDGDVFYWIQNGPPTPNSPMPAFKGKLTDDQIWHLVNYVRRLRNLAGELPSNAPQPVTTPEALLSPAPSGDPIALALLERADAVMNRLDSAVEKQTLSDDAGNQLAVLYTYAAPDRVRYQIVNGATAIQIGQADYQLGPDGSWIKNRRALPVEWPDFTYGQTASDARVEGEETLGEVLTTVVSFHYGSFSLRTWIDKQSGHILKMTMDGNNHHMVSLYDQFDDAPPVEPPD